ncbi:MAG: isoleucine--tRNA ligase [Patescibacteria group bacterium]
MLKKNRYVEKEEETLEFWTENKIFEKSVDKKAPNGDYVFYDGPPFATGTPHYGHIVASLMKDAVPRFWTMNGYRVERIWGWDCHGLPIENIVEDELDIKSKKDIEEKIGVDKFNESCRSKVLVYADEWKKFIPRIGRWADMENAYKTMDLDYMESIWWVFKTLWDKDLVYEGHKSMHVCPRCETTLSQSEVSQGYKDVKDNSGIWKFELKDEPGTYMLAWTTTPWSTISTMGLAIGPDFDYVKAKVGKEKLIFSKDQIDFVMEGHDNFEIIEEFKGKDLIGKEYKHIVDWFKNIPEVKENKGVYHVYGTDYVEIAEGTGIVTINGSYGEIDMQAAKDNNLPIIMDVNIDGKFNDYAPDYKGMFVKKAEKKIIEDFMKKGLMWKTEEYEHSYPHCWRCDSPLLNYATSSWFIKVTEIKKKALELAKDINWVPGHIKEGRFGKWLEGAEDWSISRQRFWGSVMPIWKCEKCNEMKVFGSKKELEDMTGEKIDDLHKDKMDKLTFKCEKCEGEMKRIPDVLDCWFESGSMPYAQMHYPFSNKEKFEKNFPAEFIAEGVDQTRCWFYYLLILSTGVMDKACFKNVIANGIVLAEDGQKMSKKLKNYPDPKEVIDKYGADAMRYYLLSSPVMRAESLQFSEKGVDEVFKKLIMILGNVMSFYKMFADDKVEATDNSKHILDKWILAKLNSLVNGVTENMKNYDLVLSSRPIIEFVDDLSTWYLRRSRNRIKSEDEKDKQAALSTMKYVLQVLSKTMAPFTPFIAENIYKELDGSKESVHLEDWPGYDKKLIDEKLLENMIKVREYVETGLALREKEEIRVRQPLNKLSLEGKKLDKELVELIEDEVNVKNVEFGDKDELDTKLTDELKEEGMVREIIRGINSLRKKQKLTINDEVEIIYQTDDKSVKQVISSNKSELMKNTVSTDWIEGEGEDEIKIDDIKLLVIFKIKK